MRGDKYFLKFFLFFENVSKIKWRNVSLVPFVTALDVDLLLALLRFGPPVLLGMFELLLIKNRRWFRNDFSYAHPIPRNEQTSLPVVEVPFDLICGTKDFPLSCHKAKLRNARMTSMKWELISLSWFLHKRIDSVEILFANHLITFYCNLKIKTKASWRNVMSWKKNLKSRITTLLKWNFFQVYCRRRRLSPTMDFIDFNKTNCIRNPKLKSMRLVAACTSCDRLLYGMFPIMHLILYDKWNVV